MAQGATRDFTEHMDTAAQPDGVPAVVEVNALGANIEQLGGLIGQYVDVLLAIGGVVTFAAHRVEVRPGEYETRAVVGKWDSYAPAERLAEPEVVEAEEELEPQPAGG